MTISKTLKNYEFTGKYIYASKDIITHIGNWETFDLCCDGCTYKNLKIESLGKDNRKCIKVPEFFDYFSNRHTKNAIIEFDIHTEKKEIVIQIKESKKISDGLNNQPIQTKKEHDKIELEKSQNTENINPDIHTRLANVFEKVQESYKNILVKQGYLPTRDQIGFTERNLTFYFCHHYLEVRKDEERKDEERNYNMNNPIVWQEMPLEKEKKKNERQHIDSIIIDKDNNKNEVSIFYIEAKRVYNKSFIDGKKSSLKKDRDRIQEQYTKIPGYNSILNKFNIHHYEVLLAGLEIRDNQKDKTITERTDALERFSNIFIHKDKYNYYSIEFPKNNTERLKEYRIYTYIRELK